MAPPTTWLTVERAQPVVPLLLMVCRLKPPTKEPQGMLAVLSRSPMFLAFDEVVVVLLDHRSPVGSTSPIKVKPPVPAGGSCLLVPPPGTKPLVWPANILIAPGVDGPYWSPQALSLIA